MKDRTVKWLLGCLYSIIWITARSQDTDEIYRYFVLDSIVIQASRTDLDIKKFIDYMIADKSFYQAFKNLRTANYTFLNKINCTDTRGTTALYESTATQTAFGNCRTMNEFNKKIEGRFFDAKGDYEYYTAKMYDQLFFTHDTVCESTVSNTKPTRIQKYIAELKKLMFDPGADANVPLLGHKTSIFDKDMYKYYDYKIAGVSLNGIDAYLFDISVKDEYIQQKTNKTVIKRLLTWFDTQNLQILKREYVLKGQTIAYHFDVHMDVDIIYKNNKYYPGMIKYDGEWKVLGKKKENTKFELKIIDLEN